MHIYIKRVGKIAPRRTGALVQTLKDKKSKKSMTQVKNYLKTIRYLLGGRFFHFPVEYSYIPTYIYICL
jgi:hypothetical protein